MAERPLEAEPPHYIDRGSCGPHHEMIAGLGVERRDWCCNFIDYSTRARACASASNYHWSLLRGQTVSARHECKPGYRANHWRVAPMLDPMTLRSATEFEARRTR